MRRVLGLWLAARVLSSAAAACVALVLLVGPASAQLLTDNFDSDWDLYNLGIVPEEGIWSGTHNMDGVTKFAAEGGQLVVENSATNNGWEGGRSNSQFLFADVPAGKDFTATVKIDSQTSGFWSAAGLIARAEYGNTPPSGTEGGDNADEHFVTMYSFRTNADIPIVGTTLMKRIENGAQLNDVQTNVNPLSEVPNPAYDPVENPDVPEFVNVPVAELPIWLRVERIGNATYRGYVSQDGENWQFQSRVIPTDTSPLLDPNNTNLEVGLAYTRFNGDPGETRFDDFALDIHDPLESPGAPQLTGEVDSLSMHPDFIALPGAVLTKSFEELTGQEFLSWSAALIDPLPPVDPMQAAPNPTMNPGLQAPFGSNSSVFTWNTINRQPGDYLARVTVRNDWGETDTSDLWIRLVPEPTSLLLVGLGMLGLAGMSRRRR